MSTEAADEKLVCKAQQGDQRAFGTLYSQYGRVIYSIIRHLTQETFIRAWRSLPRLQEPKAFGGWLRMIALNLTRDWLRADRPTQPLDGENDEEMPRQWADDGAGPADQLETSEQQRQVTEAIQRLNEDQRLVIVMHHLEGKPVAEIGEDLGIPVGTVLSRLARGREALRIKLAPYVEE